MLLNKSDGKVMCKVCIDHFIMLFKPNIFDICDVAMMDLEKTDKWWKQGVNNVLLVVRSSSLQAKYDWLTEN